MESHALVMVFMKKLTKTSNKIHEEWPALPTKCNGWRRCTHSELSLNSCEGKPPLIEKKGKVFMKVKW